MKTYREVENQILEWAAARLITPNARPHTQLLKLVSEVGEMCDAEAKDNDLDREDAVGDVMVCLINYCALRQIDVVACIELAYEQIKDRKGYVTPDGTFAKEV